MKVLEYSIRFEDDDGIVEPGEMCYIENIKIQNVGKMPTPIHQDILLQVKANEHVVPIEGFLIPRPMHPGQTCDIQTTARF